MMKYSLPLSYILGLILVSAQTSASTFSINFDGTLVDTQPTCTLNGSSQHQVTFGNVNQADVNSDAYLKQIDYQLTCTQLYKNALKMGLYWSNLTVNSQPSVGTNIQNLGIAIYRDSTILSSGQSLSFDISSPPNLYAKPVKPLNTTLSTLGQFTGTVTMLISYQ